MNGSERIAVVGGGLGGLAAACTLAARGHDVALFERNSWAGGKAAVLERDGFRFDMGPTILTLPSVLARISAEAGRDLSDYLDLVPLDPQWRCFYSDGSVLDLVADTEAMASRLAAFSRYANDADGYRRFMSWSQQLHEISRRFFFYRNVGSIRDTFSAQGMFDARVLRDLWALRMGRTVAESVRSHIRDPRVAQMVDHFTQYVGSCPESSPAVLCGIAHMQTDEGIWYPRGGIRAVPQALLTLARELGVQIHSDKQVRRISVRDRTATDVETDDGERYPVSAVVSNSDVIRTHGELLETTPAGRRFIDRNKREPACSGVVLYLGLRQRYDQLLHHGFAFSQDPHEEFDAIYRRGEPAQDPTCYICAPARTDPHVAPPGGEALYVLVHTPYLRPHHDWKKMIRPYRDVIIRKLARTCGLEDLEQRIVTEDVLTPEDIERRYHCWKGAIYGLASHGRMLGAFKPANRSADIHNLYFAGGSVHPGPGIPMVLMSGWIAADVLHRDRSAVTAQAQRVES